MQKWTELLRSLGILGMVLFGTTDAEGKVMNPHSMGTTRNGIVIRSVLIGPPSCCASCGRTDMEASRQPNPSSVIFRCLGCSQEILICAPSRKDAAMQIVSFWSKDAPKGTHLITYARQKLGDSAQKYGFKPWTAAN